MIKSNQAKSIGFKKVQQVSKLYVFCPDEQKEFVRKILIENGIDCELNNLELTNFSNKVICHYNSKILSQNIRDFLIGAIEKGAWVEPLVTYLDRRLGYVEIKLLHDDYFLHQKAFSILSKRSNQIIKRAIDIAFVFLLSLFAIPIGLVTAILIKLESPGPIFFTQARTGKYNVEFNVIKFRSMRNDAEKLGAQWASKNDSRVTRIGKIIRKTRIDELPQIINVLKGEMSVVGPRPEREIFIRKLEEKIPYYRFRHAVKPGITGLAQVKYQYGASIDDAKWKHKFDIHYIKHQSLFLDLKILVLTIKTVLFGMGR